MIEIDGSDGEGGGQILRTSLALSMCTGQPFRLTSIRAKRSKPGLMRQHLACVLAARDVSDGEVDGAELGSMALTFRPGAIRAGTYAFPISGAGSTMLVLQTVLPALLKADAPSTLRLSGGTHNPMAPPVHFIERAFAPFVALVGGGLQLTLRRCGFYPAGGGEVEVAIAPITEARPPLNVADRGALIESYAEALVAGVPTRVATQELTALGGALNWNEAQLRSVPLRQNEGPGNALLATLRYENVTEVCCALGERGLSSAKVASRLANQVRVYQQSHAVIGGHLADQLMLLLAVANGGSYSVTTISEHTRTNARVIERFLPVNIALEERTASPAWVTVRM